MRVNGKGLARIRRTAAAALALVAIAVLAPAAAEAATSCEYEPVGDVLFVRLSANGDFALLQLSGATIVVRQAAGIVPCSGGTAETTNTDAIEVLDESGNGGTTLAVQNPQAFAAALEITYIPGGGEDGIQIFSEAGPALIIAGKDGVNTDGAAGKDVNLIGTPERFEIYGGPGSDTLTARGTGGTGGVLSGPFVLLHGGPGNDTLEGSEGGDLIEGEAGNDTMRGFAGEDALIGDTAAEAGDDAYDGGAGFDYADYSPSPSGVTVDLAKAGPQPTGDGSDSFAEIEALLGTKFADTVLGTDAANVIKLGEGDDAIDGRGGDDLLSGGGGTDTLVYADAPAGVNVDLATGTVSGGAGKDSLGIDDFENLVGSQFGDLLSGSSAANQITGLGGVDVVAARGGADRVDVRDGGPDNASCGSEIDTAIADRRSVDTVQPDCELVDALPEAVAAGGGNGSSNGGGGQGGKGPNGGGSGGKQGVAFVLGGAKRQPLLAQGGIVVKLRCPQEACTVAVGAGRRFKPLTTRLAAGVTKTVKLAIRKAKRPAIRRLLQGGGALKLRVTATATDAAGNSSPAELTVTAKKPARPLS